MFKINTDTGETFRLDTHNESEAKKLLQLLGDRKFQQTITGLTVLRQYSKRYRCPNPKCRKPAKLICPSCGEVTDNGRVTYTGVHYTLLRPEDFDNISFHAETIEPDPEQGLKGGDKIVCFMGDVQLTIMAHASQPASRIALRKIGKQRYNPLVE